MAARRAGPTMCCVLLALCLAAPAHGEEEPASYAGKDVHWWIQELKDPKTSPIAIPALAKIGRPALEPLADALSASDESLRYPAALAIQALGVDPAPVLRRIVAALDAGNEPLTGVCLTLLHADVAAAASHLDSITPLLEAKHEKLVGRTLGLLGAMGFAAVDALPSVLRVAREGPRKLRPVALAAAVSIAPGAGDLVPVLAEILQSPREHDRYRAMMSAAKMEPATPGFDAAVAAAARDESARVRGLAAGQLARVARHNPARVADLAALLADDDRTVRARTAWALVGVGPGAESAVPALRRILGGTDKTAYPAAIRALGSIKGPGHEALPRVLGLVKKEPQSRDIRLAIEFFVGTDVSVTLDVFRDPDPALHGIASKIVASWQPETWTETAPESIRSIAETLRARPEPHRADLRVLDVLGRRALEQPAAREALFALRNARSTTVRWKGAAQAGADPRNGDRIFDMLRSAVEEDRHFAERALTGGMGIPVVPERLDEVMALLRHDDAGVRASAGHVLVMRGGLTDASSLEPHEAKAVAAAAAQLLARPENRGTALMLLGGLGEHALPHVEALESILADDSMHANGAGAASALSKIAVSSDKARARIEPMLKRRFEGEDPVGASSAALALVTLGGHDAALLARLPALLRNPKKTVHFKAVDAVRHMGAKRGAPLVPVLMELVASPMEGTQVDGWAAQTLAQVTKDEEQVARLLIQALSDPKRSHNVNAFWAALQAGGARTVRLLAAALEGARPHAQRHLLGILAGYGRRAAQAADAVKRLTDHEDARVSAAARKALKAFE